MKIVFFDIEPHEKEYFKKHLPQGLDVIYEESKLSLALAIPQYATDADIISIFTTTSLSKEILEKFTNLKFILTRSVGFSHIDLNYCKQKGINVFNAPHYGDATVAEYTFAIMLSAVRKIRLASTAVKNGQVQLNCYTGMELDGKTLGVIGAGAIGKKVIQIAQGFGMNVLAYDKFPKGAYNFVELDKLIKNSDIISINAPLTDETKHLLNKEKFDMMKKGVVIVNTARGEIIDTQALYDAVLEKKVAVAALDVVECEDILSQPASEDFCIECVKEKCLKKFLLNQKLLSLENVLITPHIGYDTCEAIERILKITTENAISCLNFNPGAKNLVLV